MGRTSDKYWVNCSASDTHPTHIILEKLAQMYRSGDSDETPEPRLVKNPERAGGLKES